ncbi:MAG: SIMPL domain-containing protein [Muriicola sp.]|nr:SIMPL domain-containing protein [Muriicola sp.]NNC61718.1 SIMPL domain-containing protein [Eudoraea sp.]NNK21007.1 SIMPL domain-containing protein [Flavobacteriaceae bacterium]NNK35947.1 SIMPL domain-containing protein [Eudoraea sp.]
MKHASSLIFGISIIIAAFFLGNAYKDRANPPKIITVTGLGNENFTSDLIVWEGYFSTFNTNLKAAFEQLNTDKEIVKNYLLSKGIPEANIIFNSVQTAEQRDNKYDNGNYIGSVFRGYSLTQSVKIESNDVKLIEEVAREITELLNKGVQFNSSPPRYYYTQLADLKIKMIAQATEDARLRAEKIAENSGGDLGNLLSAKMGVFQITGQNSDEEYSWGGVYNTSEKKKTASITMRLDYEVQ